MNGLSSSMKPRLPLSLIQWLICLALLIPAAPVRADSVDTGVSFLTGNKLFAFCAAENNITSMVCLGYIEGIADALSGGQWVNGFRACLSIHMTAQQLQDVAMRYLAAHPELRHLAAAGLVASSLANAFPCDR